MAWVHKLGHPLIAATGAWAVGSVAWAALHDPIDTTPAADCANASDVRVLTPLALRTLQQQGYVVVNGVLPQQQLNRARAQAAARFGEMKSTHENPADVRTDHIVWIQQQPHTAEHRRRLDGTIGSGKSQGLNAAPETEARPEAAAVERADDRSAIVHRDGKGAGAAATVPAATSAVGEGGGGGGTEDLDACVALLRGLAWELDESEGYTLTRGHSSPVRLQVSAPRVRACVLVCVLARVLARVHACSPYCSVCLPLRVCLRVPAVRVRESAGWLVLVLCASTANADVGADNRRDYYSP